MLNRVCLNTYWCWVHVCIEKSVPPNSFISIAAFNAIGTGTDSPLILLAVGPVLTVVDAEVADPGGAYR